MTDVTPPSSTNSEASLRPEFKQAYKEKFFGLFISVKMYVINVSLALLLYDKITHDNFEHIIIAVAGVKVVTDGIAIYQNGKGDADA